MIRKVVAVAATALAEPVNPRITRPMPMISLQLKESARRLMKRLAKALTHIAPEPTSSATCLSLRWKSALINSTTRPVIGKAENRVNTITANSDTAYQECAGVGHGSPAVDATAADVAAGAVPAIVEISLTL